MTAFTNCEFNDCIMSGIDFNDMAITKGQFRGCVMEYATFHRLKAGSNFEEVKLNLKDCSFLKCNLTESTFSNCDLKKVSFKDCLLVKALFKKCDLTEADLTGCQILGAQFGDSIIHNTLLNLDGFIQLGNSRGFIIHE